MADLFEASFGFPTFSEREQIMNYSTFTRHLINFRSSQSGETSVQLAAFFSAVAVVVALVSTPFLDKAAKEYAENRSFGIDQVITGSVNKTKRYTVRKSVFDKNPEE